jgi:hypothetical protein
MTDTPAGPAPETTPAVPTDPAALAARDAELTALYEHDPNRYQYEDGGKHATEHLAVRKAQQAKGGEPTQADQPADVGIEVDGIDLDAPVSEADGEEPEEGEDAEASETDLQWDREDFTYTPPDGAEVTETGQERINAFAEFAHKANVSPEAFEGAINFYNELVAKEQERRAETDKTARVDLVAELKGELGDGYAAFRNEVDGAFKELSQDLRRALKSARLPEGRLLLSMPEAVHMVHALSRHQTQATIQPQGSRSAMQQELAEIDMLMRSDISEYHRANWRGSNRSASDRRLEIMRQLDAPDPNPQQTRANLEDEKRELLRLRMSDPQMFAFGNWRGTGRPASDRLVALQTGRA